MCRPRSRRLHPSHRPLGLHPQPQPVPTPTWGASSNGAGSYVSGRDRCGSVVCGAQVAALPPRVRRASTRPRNPAASPRPCSRPAANPLPPPSTTRPPHRPRLRRTLTDSRPGWDHGLAQGLVYSLATLRLSAADVPPMWSMASSVDGGRQATKHHSPLIWSAASRSPTGPRRPGPRSRICCPYAGEPTRPRSFLEPSIMEGPDTCLRHGGDGRQPSTAEDPAILDLRRVQPCDKAGGATSLERSNITGGSQTKGRATKERAHERGGSRCWQVKGRRWR